MGMGVFLWPTVDSSVISKYVKREGYVIDGCADFV
jgi:hypothetical protein